MHFPYFPEKAYKNEGFKWSMVFPPTIELEQLFIKLKVVPSTYLNSVKTYPELKGFPQSMKLFNRMFPYLNWIDIVNKAYPLKKFIEILEDNNINTSNYREKRKKHFHLQFLPDLKKINKYYPTFKWKQIQSQKGIHSHNSSCYNIFSIKGLNVINFPIIKK